MYMHAGVIHMPDYKGSFLHGGLSLVPNFLFNEDATKILSHS